MKKTTRKIQNSLGTTQIFERRTVHIFAMIILVASTLYLYGMLSTVSFALSKRNTESQIRDLVAETSSLEGQYLALSQSVSIASGENSGLRVPKHISFAKITPTSFALSQVPSSF